MNIFLHELRANLKSLLIWCGILILFCVVGFAKFSAFFQNPELTSILNSFPPAMIAALSLNAFNLTTVTGFYGIMVGYLGLVLAIAAAMWGSDIISKEERDRTVEFSLTLPVTRSHLITAKTAAAAVNCVVLLGVTWGINLLGAQNYQPDSQFYAFVAISMLAFFLLQMIFLSLGIFLGSAMKRHKRAGSTTVAILLVTYFISIMAGLNKNLTFLRYLSPFKYFDASMMLTENRVEPIFVLLSIAIVAVLLTGAYLSYSKRDLYI